MKKALFALILTMVAFEDINASSIVQGCTNRMALIVSNEDCITNINWQDPKWSKELSKATSDDQMCKIIGYKKACAITQGPATERGYAAERRQAINYDPICRSLGYIKPYHVEQVIAG